jgi:hypothetical protein
MAKITVYPTKASALNIKHPIDGQLKAAGSQWENDGFTARMLSDKAVTTERTDAHKPARPLTDPNAPPPHATGA